MAHSAIRESHRTEACTRVQDAYSLRCAPVVAGGARDTVDHAARVAGWELASAVDNPVVTPDGRVESNGNFHGAPVGYVLDFLAIVAADVASMSERRTDRFLDVSRSNGLPPFLADDPGVDSGHMIAQYTQAAIVSEMKRLAAPASVDSIPSSAMQEDHVSMGWSAARKLRRAVDGLSRVLAVEVLTAARGLQLRAPLAPAPATAAVVAALVDAGASRPGGDRWLSPEIDVAHRLVARRHGAPGGRVRGRPPRLSRPSSRTNVVKTVVLPTASPAFAWGRAADPRDQVVGVVRPRAATDEALAPLVDLDRPAVRQAGDDVGRGEQLGRVEAVGAGLLGVDVGVVDDEQRTARCHQAGQGVQGRGVGEQRRVERRDEVEGVRREVVGRIGQLGRGPR